MRCQILPRSALRLASSAMDRIDRAILAQLAADGRLANTELADRVGLSPSPCLRRVRSLERSGVITGYHAHVDPAAHDQLQVRLRSLHTPATPGSGQRSDLPGIPPVSRPVGARRPGRGRVGIRDR